ncbi:MAG: hypothetical protein ABGZ17_03660, partial [Planctomycetaceae bacterium]
MQRTDSSAICTGKLDVRVRIIASTAWWIPPFDTGLNMVKSRDLFDDTTMSFGEHLEALRVHL